MGGVGSGRRPEPKNTSVASIGNEVLFLPNDSGVQNKIDTGRIKTLWDRTGTVLSPKTAGDDVTCDGALTIGTTVIDEVDAGKTIRLAGATGWEMGEKPSSAGYAVMGNANLNMDDWTKIAFMQQAGGDTFVGSPTGKKVYIRNNNSDKVTIDTNDLLAYTHIRAKSGHQLQAFSADNSKLVQFYHDGTNGQLRSTTAILCNANFQSSGDMSSVKFTATGEIASGTDDTTQGVLTAYGNASTGGGYVKLYNAADDDGTKDFMVLRADDTNVKVTAGIDVEELTCQGDGDVGGDLIFTGDGSGIPYGQINGTDESVVCTDQNTYYQVTFDAAGLVNTIEADVANNELEVTHAGVYEVNVTCCFHSSVASDFELLVHKNDGATPLSPHLFQTISVAGRVENTAGNCYVDLAANDRVELWVRCTSAGGRTAIFDHCELTLKMLGGT